LFLGVLVAILTLLINPPNAWVNKISEREDKKNKQRQI
jgi:hypothetical protein